MLSPFSKLAQSQQQAALRLADGIKQLLFPARQCLSCGATIHTPGLCPSCQQALRQLHRCRHCPSFLPQGVGTACPHCQEQPPPFVRALAAAPYRGLLRQRLLDFKYHEATYLRRPLAALLADCYEQELAALGIEAVVPTPLHPNRLAQRGYNQSELLSRTLAAEYRLPHYPQLLQRRLDTPPLHSYGRAERYRLMALAITTAAPCPPQHLLLIDDIYTSGATAQACARALLAAGAKQVSLLTVAAPPLGESVAQNATSPA